ncbi:MAG: hypothetical protein EOO16_12610 [Chitinophagaceae bacterium]|nr:MAG: hypothetical protein EOO16_12610 [Chitinophagaceae bacterium]
MDAADYEQIIESGDVLDGSTINITLKELHFRKEAELVAALKRILATNAIEKPEGGSASSVTWYRIDLAREEAERIVDLFLDLEGGQLGEGGTPTPVSQFYGALADKWTPFT